MSERFQQKYRIPSARASWWNYGNDGAYFVTICTQVETRLIASLQKPRHIHHFGEIEQLSEIGQIAYRCWQLIPQQFSFVHLDAFVVMPNHIHGIVIIDNGTNANGGDGDDGRNGDGRDAINRVSTGTTGTTGTTDMDAPAMTIGGFAGNKNPMLNQNLARIIRWYKGRTTFESRKIHANFAWQPNYHEHIIRNEQSHQRIANYIIDNPMKWKDDKFNQS